LASSSQITTWDLESASCASWHRVTDPGGVGVVELADALDDERSGVLFGLGVPGDVDGDPGPLDGDLPERRRVRFRRVLDEGEGRLEATVPLIDSADETTDVGVDLGTPVSDDDDVGNTAFGRVGAVGAARDRRRR